MSGATHTPLVIGTPWFTEVTDEILGRDADGEVFVVAQINPLAEMPQEVVDSHGRLIAAAPDLLEALIQLLKADDSQSRGWAKDAIAKATGAK